MSKTVGIIGGMGPMATVDMMQKIISHTPAKTDQEHLHIIVDNNPKIPDRMAAILSGGTDLVPFLVQSAQLLQNTGAELLVIACNSAHYFLPEVQKEVTVPILNMPNETAIYMKKLALKKVGMLATDATLRKKLFHKPFQSQGITLLEPDPYMQKMVMKGIFHIKQGDLKSGKACFLSVCDLLVKNGAEAIVAGCTEISLVLHSTAAVIVIDPTDILTQSVVKEGYDQYEGDLS
ncbi:aspartate racemase [Virgibacillus phasianinus]|uniref:Aspartate racemase n=1 Tax=Virgibacillus phasianinus TaxID=2017483 RepID=A0A220U6N5_9BACI|nr:amino acid racemase [Virgibacillus phasianinus]ASK63787.1 aspartate racemase [Virgibacillus phasianinus]